MLPRLGAKYQVACEVIAKPKEDYLTDEYFALDLPVAPAIMVDEEVVTEGSDVDDYQLECVLCRHLGLPAPAPREKGWF